MTDKPLSPAYRPSLEVTVERVIQEYARIAFASVDVEPDHGKALQATRLKLQSLAVLTRHLGLFAAQGKPGLTAEERERNEARAASSSPPPNEPKPSQDMAIEKLEWRPPTQAAKGDVNPDLELEFLTC